MTGALRCPHCPARFSMDEVRAAHIRTDHRPPKPKPQLKPINDEDRVAVHEGDLILLGKRGSGRSRTSAGMTLTSG